MANDADRCEGCGDALVSVAGTAPRRSDLATSTYRYRAPAGRRAYMRDYMRAYRARKKLSGAAVAVI